MLWGARGGVRLVWSGEVMRGPGVLWGEVRLGVG